MVWISNLLLSYLENVKNKATTLLFLWGHKKILQSKHRHTWRDSFRIIFRWSLHVYKNQTRQTKSKHKNFSNQLSCSVVMLLLISNICFVSMHLILVSNSHSVKQIFMWTGFSSKCLHEKFYLQGLEGLAVNKRKNHMSVIIAVNTGTLIPTPLTQTGLQSSLCYFTFYFIYYWFLLSLW